MRPSLLLGALLGLAVAPALAGAADSVGAATAFSGGLAVTEPVCLVLEARVRGREPVRRAISLGMGDSCPPP